MNTRKIFIGNTVYGKRRIMSKVVLSLYLLVIIGFTGCAGKEYKPNLVYKEWTRTMSQEGIFPVFPPREDIQAGDIWLLPIHPLETRTVELVGGLGHTGIWYDNIFDQKGEGKVDEFYANRYSFPKTTALYSKDSKAGTSPQNKSSGSNSNVAKDAAKTFLSGNSSADLSDVKILEVPTTGTESVFSGGDVRRLRQVAFPEFSIANITQAALNALVPIEYFQVAGGVTFNRIKQISLKIPLAESYGIPLKKVFNALSEKGIEIQNKNGAISLIHKSGTPESGTEKYLVNTLILARSQFNEALENISEAPGLWFYKGRIEEELEMGKNYVWVALINEVFYARAIDISITTIQGTGGGARVEPITDNMLNALKRLDELKKERKITVEETTKNQKEEPAVDTESPADGSTPEPSAVSESPSETKSPPGGAIVKNIEITQQDDAFTLAQKINSFNAASGQQSMLGGSINVVSVSNTGVGLRRIYDRPIAVGVRGVIMKINVENLGQLRQNEGIPITLE